MSEGWVTRWAYALSALLAAAVIVAGAVVPRVRFGLGTARTSADLALLLAAIGYLVAAVRLIWWDPQPRIDVWVTLQQAADGIAHGKNIYSLNWTGSPGVQDAFQDLLFTALLLAPGRWLAGDVRWALVVVTLLGVLAVRLLGEPVRGEQASGAARLAAAGAAILLLLMPGDGHPGGQAWTEPLLMASPGWALACGAATGWPSGVSRWPGQQAASGLGRRRSWPPGRWFGPPAHGRHGPLGRVVGLPWSIASRPTSGTTMASVPRVPVAGVRRHPGHRRDQRSLVDPAVLPHRARRPGDAGRRRGGRAAPDPDLAVVLRWFGLMLFVANLVNKQAFYNQHRLARRSSCSRSRFPPIGRDRGRGRPGVLLSPPAEPFGVRTRSSRPAGRQTAEGRLRRHGRSRKRGTAPWSSDGAWSPPAAVSCRRRGGRSGTYSTFTQARTKTQNVATGTFAFNLADPAVVPSTDISGLAPGDFADRLVDLTNTGSLNYATWGSPPTASPTSALDSDPDERPATDDRPVLHDVEPGLGLGVAATCGAPTSSLTRSTAVSALLDSLGGHVLHRPLRAHGRREPADHLSHYALPAASAGSVPGP